MSSATSFTVTGMTCGHCVRHVEEALRKVPGVERVEAAIGSAKVQHTPSTSEAALVAAIADAGYDATVA